MTNETERLYKWLNESFRDADSMNRPANSLIYETEEPLEGQTDCCLVFNFESRYPTFLLGAEDCDTKTLLELADLMMNRADSYFFDDIDQPTWTLELGSCYAPPEHLPMAQADPMLTDTLRLTTDFPMNLGVFTRYLYMSVVNS